MARRSESEVLEEFEQRARSFLGSPDGDADADTASAAGVIDGRVAIRLRNREKIIGALIELVVEGKVGTIDEIVERSGVARRSIFRHFTDLSDLWLAGMRAVITRTAPLSILKDPGVGPLDHRIESFVDARLRTLALMYPFRSGVSARLSELDAVRAGLRATTEMLRIQIAGHFADELGTMRPADAEGVVDAVYVVTSYESYDIAVAQIGRSVETVRTTWLGALTRLLAP